MEHPKPKRGLAPKIAVGILLFGALLILLSATPKSLWAGLTTISRDYDDFDLADVVFIGEQEPELDPDATLATEVNLAFVSGQAGTFDFIVSFEAEGPIPTPTPEHQPNVVAVLTGMGDEITEPFTTTRSPWSLDWEQSANAPISFYLNDRQTGARVKLIRSFSARNGT